MKYKSKNGSVWEYYYGKWFCNDRWIPGANFYEEGADEKILKRIESGKMGVEKLLVYGNNMESLFCSTGRIYYVSKIANGKGRLMRTKMLERI